MPRICSRSGLLLSLLFASSASAITIDWSPVGNPGNVADPQTGYGAVGYAYNIGTDEVTNAQYAAFLNAVAVSDPNGLYNPEMTDNGNGPINQNGGIIRNGLAGSYSYSTKAGFENRPVNYVGFWDALRFANWLNNGQPTGAQGPGTTEDGAYTITLAGITGNSITRNPGATVFLPSEDEWYKAAYYNGAAGTYYLSTVQNAAAICAPPPSGVPYTANCDQLYTISNVADVGSYTASPGPYGTFDQGGNVREWNEAIIGANRGERGGNFVDLPQSTLSTARNSGLPNTQDYGIGFRVASAVPEPGTGLLVFAGLLGFASWRRVSSA